MARRICPSLVLISNGSKYRLYEAGISHSCHVPMSEWVRTLWGRHFSLGLWAGYYRQTPGHLAGAGCRLSEDTSLGAGLGYAFPEIPE